MSIVGNRPDFNDGFAALLHSRRALLSSVCEGLRHAFTVAVPDDLMAWKDVCHPSASPEAALCRLDAWWSSGRGPQEYDGRVVRFVVNVATSFAKLGQAVCGSPAFFSHFVSAMCDRVVAGEVTIVQASAMLACAEQELVARPANVAIQNLAALEACWDPEWFSRFMYFTYCPTWTAGAEDRLSPLWNPDIMVNHISEELSFPTMTISLFWRYCFETLCKFVDDYGIPMDPLVRAMLANCRSGLCTGAYVAGRGAELRDVAYQQSILVGEATYPYPAMALAVEAGMPSWSVPGTGKEIVGASGSQPAGERDRTTSFLMSECIRWYASCYESIRAHVKLGGATLAHDIEGSTLTSLIMRYALSDGSHRIRDLFLVAVKQVSKVRQASTVVFQTLRAKNSKWGGSTKNIDIIRALCPADAFPETVDDSVVKDLIAAVNQRRAAKTEVTSERKNTVERKLRQQQRGSSAMLRSVVGMTAEIVKVTKAAAKRAEAGDDEIKKPHAKRARSAVPAAKTSGEAAIALVPTHQPPPKFFHMMDYLREKKADGSPPSRPPPPPPPSAATAPKLSELTGPDDSVFRFILENMQQKSGVGESKREEEGGASAWVGGDRA